MNLIIPLAGPDLINASGQNKCLRAYKNGFLLKEIILSRPWYSSVKQMVFVLLDNAQSRKFAINFLQETFPNSNIVFVSTPTLGAAMSSLAGVSVLKDVDAPLIIDLADIDYEIDWLDPKFLAEDLTYDALALCFSSNHPCYSYLAFDETNEFLKAKEKDVISSNASAGTYIFRDASIFIGAMSSYLKEFKQYRYNSLFYLCPALNGVRLNGGRVIMHTVKNVFDIDNGANCNEI